MKQQFLTQRPGNDKLALIFSGYGQDLKVYSHLCSPKDTDVAVVFDYGSVDFDASLFAAYRSIGVLAWSMGVMTAPFLLVKSGLVDKVALAVAVNGTKEGIDDTLGIPILAWQEFIDGLSESSVLRFYRRMCGNLQLFREYMRVKPERDTLSLKSELERLLALSKSSELKKCASYFNYDRAYAGTRDLIFSFESQQASWSLKPTSFYAMEGLPHYCPELFNEVLAEF